LGIFYYPFLSFPLSLFITAIRDIQYGWIAHTRHITSLWLHYSVSPIQLLSMPPDLSYAALIVPA
jgi:hypothetical protein